MSTILVTGAATGFGNVIARTLGHAGHTVYASMRNTQSRNAPRVEEIRAYAAEHDVDLRTVELDVQSQESCDAAIAAVLSEQAALDVAVHNAGHLAVGPTEAITPEEIARVFDINALGAQRVNRAVLPHMREARAGLLLWVGSTTSQVPPPFLGPYVAAKAAMDGLAAVTAYEVAPFGIETATVVPGAFTSGTEHFADAGHPADSEIVAGYAPIAGLLDQIQQRLEALTPPDADVQAVADEIARVVDLPVGERPMSTVVDPDRRRRRRRDRRHGRAPDRPHGAPGARADAASRRSGFSRALMRRPGCRTPGPPRRTRARAGSRARRSRRSTPRSAACRRSERRRPRAAAGSPLQRTPAGSGSRARPRRPRASPRDTSRQGPAAPPGRRAADRSCETPLTRRSRHGGGRPDRRRAPRC